MTATPVMPLTKATGIHTSTCLIAAIQILIVILPGQRVSASSEVDSLSSKPYDVSYDWASTVIAKGKGGCTLAKEPSYRPPPTCPPPQTSINRANASQLGWRFAPILYQHPLDNSWLTDPQRWMSMASAYDMVGWEQLLNRSVRIPEGVRFNRAEDEYLSSQEWFATRMTVPKYDPASKTVSFDTVNGTTLLERAVIDPVVDGRLTGKVWFTMFRPFDSTTGEIIPHAYVFTYMYWYPYNGCSNQLLATQVGNKKQGVEYFMCGEGAHEGDLEHIKVYVCEADMLNDDPSSAIRRTQYSQHGWLPDLDCTAGECAFETDEEGTRRLVALAGLYSHANWKAETPLYVYSKIRLHFLLNMDGLYLGDRYKKGPVFQPTRNNTAFLPFRAEMTDEEKAGPLAWSIFPGIWGATLGSTGGRTITCFKDNFTALSPCNARNPAYYILDVFTDPKGWQQDQIEWTAKQFGNTVTGPLWQRVFAYSWEVERPAPLYSKNEADGLCPLEVPLESTGGSYNGFRQISLRQYLGAVTGLVLTSAVVAFAMILPALLVRRDREVIRQIEEEQEALSVSIETQSEAPVAAAGKAAVTEAPAVVAAGAELQNSSSGEASKDECSSCAAPEMVQTPLTLVPPGLVLSPRPPPPPLRLHAHPLGALTSVPADAATAIGAVPSRGGAGRSRLSLLLMSHRTILRAFHASVMQPGFLVMWIFVGVGLYACGVALCVLGVRDSVAALNSVAPLALWAVLHTAIVAALIVFGILHLAIVVTSILVRPTRAQLVARGPRLVGCGMECLNRSWAAHAVLAGLLVMEMNVSMLLFALGLMLWIARYMMTEACVSVVRAAFRGIIFLEDVCLNLSSVGLSDSVCGSELTDICNIWAELHVDFLSFGSMCFIIAQAMFLALATTNYVATRTGYAISAVMHLTQKAEEKRATQPRSRSGSFLRLRQAVNGLRHRSKGGTEQAGGEGSKKDTQSSDGKPQTPAHRTPRADKATAVAATAAPTPAAAATTGVDPLSDRV